MATPILFKWAGVFMFGKISLGLLIIFSSLLAAGFENIEDGVFGEDRKSLPYFKGAHFEIASLYSISSQSFIYGFTLGRMRQVESWRQTERLQSLAYSLLLSYFGPGSETFFQLGFLTEIQFNRQWQTSKKGFYMLRTGIFQQIYNEAPEGAAFDSVVKTSLGLGYNIAVFTQWQFGLFVDYGQTWWGEAYSSAVEQSLHMGLKMNRLR